MAEKKSTIMVSQVVSNGARDKLNMMTNALELYAINKRIRGPFKGEVLDWLITYGYEAFMADKKGISENYFKEK